MNYKESELGAVTGKPPISCNMNGAMTGMGETA
jgi:hypothetical protein